MSGRGERQDVGGGERRDVGGKKQNSSFTEFLRPHVELALGRGFDDNVGRNAVTPIFEVHLWAGGGLIDFDDVSVVVGWVLEWLWRPILDLQALPHV